MKKISEIVITPEQILLNGKNIDIIKEGACLLNDAYKQYVNNYPKFYKMDGLCKLGFLASELLLMDSTDERFMPREDRAIILFSRSGSINADKHYQTTISDANNFFPSPSAFVYTLPNIVTGEIAIRNKYYGETSFFVMDHYDGPTVHRIIEAAFTDECIKSALTGWIEYYNTYCFEARIYLICK